MNTDLPNNSHIAGFEKPRNRNWIWLFVVMFSLAAIAAGINLTYNLRQQLTPEQLRIAKAKWDKANIDDYDLTVHKVVMTASSDRGIKDVITIQVRKNTVTDAQLNGQAMERRLWTEYDMSAWFEYLERFLEMDRKPDAPRSFCIGQFDESDGHIIKYIRSVSATGDRQELNMELKRP